MRIHREGRLIIPISFLILAGIWTLIWWPLHGTVVEWITYILAAAGLVFFGFIVNFFRDPKVDVKQNAKQVLCPCDGKVVVIEEVFDPIYFKKNVRQISIFMSPLNVHVNRNPTGGVVKFLKYSPGKNLVAWHPKSSTENEQTFVVIEGQGMELGFKQIAGAVARRIRWYIKVGDTVQQGAEMGFIRFGSRVDVLMPLDVKVTVNLEQDVKAGVTVVGEI
jgi:phosphatidylserine decarboxylase